MQSITTMTHIANITQNQMDSLSDLLSQTLVNSADTTFQEPQRRIKSTNNACKNHKWFGTDCHNNRKVYNKARKKYNKYPTQHNKTVLHNASKVYKKTMNKYINNYNQENEIELRQLHSKKPKEYWIILNKKKKCKMP